MVTARMGQVPKNSLPWAADNGRFRSPHEYTDEKYLMWLLEMKMRGHLERCLFATAPDVVGDAAATLELSAGMYYPIRTLGYPVALVAQDGLTESMVPWERIDALFTGGSTQWKLSEEAYALQREAKQRGKWTHMGRVNSWRRFSAAASAGYDSADGTVLKHDPKRPVGEWMHRAIKAQGFGL